MPPRKYHGPRVSPKRLEFALGMVFKDYGTHENLSTEELSSMVYGKLKELDALDLRTFEPAGEGV